MIRPGTSADRARVCAIAAQAMRGFGLTPDFEDLDRDLGRFGDPQARHVAYLVAEREGVVVGSLILSGLDGACPKLGGFYVDAQARGGGIGRALLVQAIAVARAHGCRAIYLETWDSMAAAVRLYGSLGWQRGERLPPQSGAEWSYLLTL